MRRRGLWILLLILAAGLLVVVLNHDRETIAGLTTDDFATLTYLLAVLIFVAGSAFALFRSRLSEAIEATLFWLVVAALLVLGYSYRFELRGVADRVMTELVPGYVASSGRTVEIVRGRSGDFPVEARVNGAPVGMVLDTGASSVVLTHEAAKAAGLPLEVLDYDVNVETANGRTRAAAVTLDRLAVGDIVERSVPALIAQPGRLRRSLLGMTFLNRLESWQVRGDRLMLRSYP